MNSRAPVAGVVVVLTLAATAGCSERQCRSLKGELLSRYDPFADRCTAGAGCLSGVCEPSGTGVCRCEFDSECRSGLCLSGLCANPDHDRRLTPALAEVGLPVRPVCDAFLPAERVLNTDAACNAVLELLEARSCAVCDEAALQLCACRTGAAMHECLIDLAATRSVSEGAPGDASSVLLCEDQVERTECVHHRGPAQARCGDASECRSGLCRDVDPDNNVSGDDPRDWFCVDPCRDDDDCLTGWRCNPNDPVLGAPPGRPNACYPPVGN